VVGCRAVGRGGRAVHLPVAVVVYAVACLGVVDGIARYPGGLQSVAMPDLLFAAQAVAVMRQVARRVSGVGDKGVSRTIVVEAVIINILKNITLFARRGGVAGARWAEAGVLRDRFAVLSAENPFIDFRVAVVIDFVAYFRGTWVDIRVVVVAVLPRRITIFILIHGVTVSITANLALGAVLVLAGIVVMVSASPINTELGARAIHVVFAPHAVGVAAQSRDGENQPEEQACPSLVSHGQSFVAKVHHNPLSGDKKASTAAVSTANRAGRAAEVVHATIAADRVRGGAAAFDVGAADRFGGTAGTVAAADRPVL